ncbi:MAG TPA: inosine/xanthosine triphosphatase [Candidatus Saccharimonadales bacterium]|nr:inosine/xanthosine triphosphatase [Candidatus Saccharimonadales bacterium]
MKVAIGTKNPSKLAAAEQAFKTFFPDADIEFIPVEVASGISDQPMTDEETLRGALTRAKSALQETGADYGVGLEGGLQQIADYWMVGNIAAVVNAAGDTAAGASARVALPKTLVPLVLSGTELNDAVHQLTNIKDNGKKEGALGLLSRGAVTRSGACREAILLALNGVENDQA